MARRSHAVTFANFNCRFGSRLALLDMWDEIVWPAFSNPEPRYTRSYGTFYLLDPELIRIGDEVFVSGRFVRDTTLERELILEDGVLKSSKAELEAAFSARFILRLSTHTLVWVAESRHAPSIASFHATIGKSLGQHWKNYIEHLLWEKYPNHKRTERGEIRAALMEKFPMPVLDIVPYPSEQSVAGFLSKISVLTEVTYRVVDPNPHYDGAETGAILLGLKQNLAARRATLKLNDPDGLDQEAAAQQIVELNGSGIIETQVKGKGPHGENITGDSESMQVKVQVDPLPDDTIEATDILKNTLEEQEQAGVLKVGKVTDHVRNALERIIQNHFATEPQ